MDKDKIPRMLSDVLKAILNFDDIKVLRQKILSIDKSGLMTWRDESGLDLFHHTIIANNMEVVNLFLTQGFFIPPHNPDHTPYLHLACSLGHRTIMNMILQERPNDNIRAKFKGHIQREIPKQLEEGSNIDKNESKLTRTFKELQMTFREDNHDRRVDQSITPLDVAARNGHVACVKELLSHTENTTFNLRQKKIQADPEYLTLACKVNSVCALKLLLLEYRNDKDIKSAIEVSLKNGNAECLDTLLRLKIVNTSEMYGRMNFFHVLFSYSLQFAGNWYELLLTMTSVLLRNGHNVRACVPSRTYPLYSLLSHPYCHDFENSCSNLTACLLLILNSGADPNFDEKSFEDDMNSLWRECRQAGSERSNALQESSVQTDSFLGIQHAFGRPAFSSGLHSLLYTLNEYSQSKLEETDILWSYVTKCTELLLHHGANPNHVGQIGENSEYGNTLHYLAHIVNIGTNLKLVQLLMQFGASPELNIDKKTPLSVLFESILTHCPDSSSSVVSANCWTLASAFIGVMGRSSVARVLSGVKAYINGRCTKHQIKFFEQIIFQIEKSVSSVSTLQKMCKLLIFEHCCRKIHNVYKLPLPISLRADIGNLIQYF